MKNTIPLLLAVVFAGVAIYGIVQFLNSQKVTQTTVSIIVAKWEIREGEEIRRDALKTKRIDISGFLRGSMIRSGDENDFIGYRSMMNFNADDPILIPGLTLAQDVKEPLAPKVEEGLRAVSVPVSGVTAVSNLVEPGDHVDVLMSLEIPKIEERDISLSGVQGAGNINVPTKLEMKEPATVYILQDATVLATGKKVMGKELRRQFVGEFDLGYDTVTLACSPEEAPLIAFAMANGGSDSFCLLLRNPTDESVLEEVQVTTFKTVLDLIKLSDLLKKRQTRRVTIYKGGAVEN